ncbi:unnamed protein product [Microthlaspi erraticum]|uniref:F-box domain-containing protein n=1 Tax=Microthlaspi erraticum TaxID=1685480 RepID=A0A6D2IQ05_9BRAS|nr:unnamed protein product [Microthlaspi erraticum]
MALGKKRIIAQRSNSNSNSKHRRDVDDEGLGLGLELVQYKRGFGRKRVQMSSGDSILTSKISSKNRTSASDGQSQELEDLPQDVLVRILCGVEHEDLKPLFHVSKTIREATLVAKQSHFAYNTPRKAGRDMFGFGKPFGLSDGDDDEIKAPGAPLQKRYRLSRINRDEDNSGLSVALFN